MTPPVVVPSTVTPPVVIPPVVAPSVVVIHYDGRARHDDRRGRGTTMTAAAYYDIDVPGECRHESRQQQGGKYRYISQFVHSLLLDQRSLVFYVSLPEVGFTDYGKGKSCCQQRLKLI